MSGAGGQAGGKKGGRDRRREGKSGRSGRSDQRWPGMLRACRAPRPVSGAEEMPSLETQQPSHEEGRHLASA